MRKKQKQETLHHYFPEDANYPEEKQNNFLNVGHQNIEQRYRSSLLFYDNSDSDFEQKT